jgi:hypothetical protein
MAASSWVVLADNIPATAPMNTHTAAVSGAAPIFCRIEVKQ